MRCRHCDPLAPQPITAAETERLIFLIEECGEVIQAATKIMRFGWDSYHPNDAAKTTNRTLLFREITDLEGCVELLRLLKDTPHRDAEAVDLASRKKLQRARYPHEIAGYGVKL